MAFWCGAAEPVVLAPGLVVSNALAHSQRLKILGQDTAVAEARALQARAMGRPSLGVDARSQWYVGLEDASLGPQLQLPAIEDRYSMGAGLTQPAYTGGRLTGLREAARHQKDAAMQDRKGAMADVTYQALSAYWTWAKAFQARTSIEAAVARMAAHSVDMENLRQSGLATENDTLATEVLLDKTRLRREESRRRAEVAAARITFLTGQPLPEGAVPEEAAAPPQTFPVESELLALAQAHRAERAAGLAQSRQATAQVKTARADALPQVSLIARYEVANPNQYFFPPRDEWNHDAFAGIAVSWNLFDWGLTRAKVAEAQGRANQARLRNEQVDDQIALEVREARINAEDAAARLAVAERAEGSAQRNLKAATDLWQNGLSRHAEVLDAHAQLTDAQYEIIAARADVALTQAALEHAVGRKLPAIP